MKRRTAGAHGQPNPGEPAVWAPTVYAGLFKTFRLGRHVVGQTQLLYNVVDSDGAFGFNKLRVRFGFEYKILRKKKSDQE